MGKLYFIISRLSLGCIMGAVVTAFAIQFSILMVVDVPTVFFFIMSVVFSLLGYGIKYLFDKLSDSFFGDSVKKGIVAVVLNVILPLITIVGITYLITLLPDSVYDLLRTDETTLYANFRANFKFAVYATAFVGMFLGMILWRSDADAFYAEPITLSGGCGAITILYGLKIMTNYYDGSASWQSEIFAVLLLVVIAAYAVISSQVCVMDLYSSVRDFYIDRVDNRALMYNYILLLFMVPLFLLLLGLSWLSVNGIAVLFRIVLYLIFRKPEIIVIGQGVNGVVDVISVLILILLVASFIARGKLVKLFTTAVHRITHIVGWIIYALLDRREKHAPDVPEDEETKYQDALINEYIFEEPRLMGRDTFENFLRRLQQINGLDRQIGYAYRKMCDMYRGEGAKIKDSDTPREVARKLTKVSEGERETVVRMIEKVKFSTDPLSDEEKDKILAELCRIIRRQYI